MASAGLPQKKALAEKMRDPSNKRFSITESNASSTGQNL
jgi:hypothetical protein